MQLKTIFNRVTDYKPFVVEKVNWSESTVGMTLELTMRARTNGQAICSGCGERRPGYDHSSSPRRFEFIPLWMIPVVLIYQMRRVGSR